MNIDLTDYEIANLRSMLEAARCRTWNPRQPNFVPENPLHVFGNGGWIDTLYDKLPQVECKPNYTPQELAQHSLETLDNIKELRRRASSSAYPDIRSQI